MGGILIRSALNCSVEEPKDRTHQKWLRATAFYGSAFNILKLIDSQDLRAMPLLDEDKTHNLHNLGCLHSKPAIETRLHRTFQSSSGLLFSRYLWSF